MTFGLVSKSKAQSHYKVIFTSVGSQKDVVRLMKSTSMVNLRKNIIATGLLTKFPTALIFTAKGAMVGSVKRMSKGKTAVYIWQGEGDKPYKCKTDGRLEAVKTKKIAAKRTVPKAAKPKVVPKLKSTFGNKFLDEHIIIASIPKYKGRA